MASFLTVEKTRDGLVETLHRGYLLHVGADGQVIRASEGAAEHRAFLRSSAKPFQAAMLLTLPEPVLSLSPREWAIACGSHAGRGEHVQAVRRLLQRGKSKPQHLLCGKHYPLDAPTALRLQRANKTAQAVHHNCSGKHAAHLLACERNHWDKASYPAWDHPLQQHYRQQLEQWLGESLEHWGRDDCTLPVPYLSLEQMTKLYRRLLSDPLFKPIINAMQTYPNLVAGRGRLDTLLMERSGGQLLSKVGAAGLVLIAHPEQQDVVALRLEDGNLALRDEVAIAYCEAIGWLPSKASRPEELPTSSNAAHSPRLTTTIRWPWPLA